ncbi:hypothetical protein EV182_004446 [Spiromyces aspiralis]|uniref:Uncharacterized protein n=1 Tax=Spiromyces aspiralis TaxID=68401 RepID=A0ACC1HDZ0_9FUNG|nr:hypothetical protein EV182_004446 [Spiromyces aspiralis]
MNVDRPANNGMATLDGHGNENTAALQAEAPSSAAAGESMAGQSSLAQQQPQAEGRLSPTLPSSAPPSASFLPNKLWPISADAIRTSKLLGVFQAGQSRARDRGHREDTGRDLNIHERTKTTRRGGSLHPRLDDGERSADPGMASSSRQRMASISASTLSATTSLLESMWPIKSARAAYSPTSPSRLVQSATEPPSAQAPPHHSQGVVDDYYTDDQASGHLGMSSPRTPPYLGRHSPPPSVATSIPRHPFGNLLRRPSSPRQPTSLTPIPVTAQRRKSISVPYPTQFEQQHKQ